ncbi:uncharacterized protein LOC131674668 [Phymastichus coffea]|uniref:uncharacterized protein LOC131674668 n=1 Tax=Phymastichus coffea TaxID=108790 RepID=UPI00273BC553|nr:uncharacterized protein LOC131674668 [Phymastichus coffea]
MMQVTGGASASSSSSPIKPMNNKYDRLRRKGLAFFASVFSLRKSTNCLLAGMRIDEGTSSTSTTTTQRSTRLIDNQEATGASRIPSTLSVDAMACRQAATSPSHSILTLTPGRTRNIDQDMEAIRLSRQDNPYLQILASKESLIESHEESESDDVILMSQEFGDTDPLTLAQVHEHLVRSPPPVSWNHTPVFHFPHQQQQLKSPGSKSEQSASHYNRAASPKSMPFRGCDEHKADEIRDRHSHTFSLLNPTPIRSLSEVRRLHRSAEDSVQLMSSE